MSTNIQEELKKITENLERTVQSIGLISHILLQQEMGTLEKPKAIEVAQQVLESSNAAVEEVIEQVKEDVPDEGADSSPSTDDGVMTVGSIVGYLGTKRKDLWGKSGTVVEVKPAGWFVVDFEKVPGTVTVRKGHLTRALSQPLIEKKIDPAWEEYAAKLVARKKAVSNELSIEEEFAAKNKVTDLVREESPDILLDDEAATYHIPKGIYSKFSDIHHIYKAGDKEQSWLRFRATKALGDEKTQEMVKRYLASVQDAQYLAAVSQ